MKRFMFLSFFWMGIVVSGLVIPSLSQAVPAPPSLKQLCKNSHLIVLGHYVGGMVSEPQDCRFWVTFQVKPDKYYKKPGNLENLKVIQFKKRYFVDTKQCALIPGPNAMPGQMKEDLSKPSHEKKLFFLKEGQGTLKDLVNIFWGIIDWDTAPSQWHKEFKETKECHS